MEFSRQEYWSGLPFQDAAKHPSVHGTDPTATKIYLAYIVNSAQVKKPCSLCVLL